MCNTAVHTMGYPALVSKCAPSGRMVLPALLNTLLLLPFQPFENHTMRQPCPIIWSTEGKVTYLKSCSAISPCPSSQTA